MASESQTSDEVYAKCMEVELDSQMAESVKEVDMAKNVHDGDDVSGSNEDHINHDQENEEGSKEQETLHEKKKCTHCNCEAAMFMSMRGGAGGRGGGGRGMFFGRGAGGRRGGSRFFGGRGGGGSRFGGRGFNEEIEQQDDASCIDPRMDFEGIGGRAGGRGGGFRGLFDRRFGVEFYEQGLDGLGSFWARPCIAHGDTCNCGVNTKNPKSKDTEAKQKPTGRDEEHDSENEDAHDNTPPCTCNMWADIFGARGGRGRGGWGRGGRGGSYFGQDPRMMGYSQCRRGWQGLGARAPFARPQHFPDQHESPSMTFGISLPPHSSDVRPPFPPQANFEGCRFRGPRPVRPEHGLVW